NEITPSSDYSKFLNSDGTLQDIDVNKLLPSFTASDIKIDEAAVTADEAYLDAQHQSMLSAHQYADEDPSLTVKEGDTINLDYVGTIDGEAFDGGSTDGAGTTLEIGSGSYIDDFEDQLVGTHPGDEVTVSVTFPDDYSNEELQGKDAEFAVTVNGIMTMPEWNDDFVAEYYSDTASTTADYDAYLSDSYRSMQISSSVNDYLQNSVTLTEYPKKYLRHLESLIMNEDNATYEQIRSMYNSYGINFPYNSLEEYNANYYPDGYEAHLEKDAMAWMGKNVAVQKIFTDNGLTVTDEDYTDYLTISGITEETENAVGKPYLMQLLKTQKAVEFLEQNADVGNYPSAEPEAEEAPAE
ncbi:MAG: FKBP-type peptidyl-prolyl cis-trans isomerase, partial [Lachnospiraceae bacterium]|nr:FKBP-type peptidyl-prolyl cis-trans isomerase [Lachnospiraceae bacterium]